jgi:hypothetical protein
MQQQSSWELDTIGGELNRQVMLPSGFHPLYAKGTPNGVCLHMESSDQASIVTKWDGSDMNIPIILKGSSILEKWAQAVQAIKMGNMEVDTEDLNMMVSLLTDADIDYKKEEPEFTRLEVGDFIAYLMPGIPPSQQDHFTITQVTGVSPLELANGHHRTLFASGQGEISRYDPESKRVIFPVKNITDVLK